jgi:hypothetical protein
MGIGSEKGIDNEGGRGALPGDLPRFRSCCWRRPWTKMLTISFRIPLGSAITKRSEGPDYDYLNFNCIPRRVKAKPRPLPGLPPPLTLQP